jgi:hypothetical protein
MDDEGVCNLLQALLSLTSASSRVNGTSAESDTDSSTSSEFFPEGKIPQFPMSPASEACAEVLISELALRNRNRLTMLWHNHLNFAARFKAIEESSLHT